jgi:hypothetical protein
MIGDDDSDYDRWRWLRWWWFQICDRQAVRVIKQQHYYYIHAFILRIIRTFIQNLLSNLMLLYTGRTHSSSDLGQVF